MYEIIGRIGNEIVSRYYTTSSVHADQVRDLGSIRLSSGYILKLEAIPLNEPIKNYVGTIRDCVEYGVNDVADIPEFE